METLFSQTNNFRPECQSVEERDRFLSDLVKDKKANVHLLEEAGLFALENRQWLLAGNIFSSLLERRNKVLDIVGLGKAFCGQSHLDLAEKHYLSALDKITEPCLLLFIVYKSLGEIHVLKKNFRQAEEYYNKASTLNPYCQNLIFHRAMMYLKERNYKEAEEKFQTFIKSNLDSSEAWLGLALTRKALGDEPLALACLNRSLDFDPENFRALSLKKRWQPSLQEMFSCSLNFLA